MAQDNVRNTRKDRKTEAQERFEQADNAGRFAGDDADAHAARQRAEEDISRVGSSTGAKQNKGADRLDTPAKRTTNQAQDISGEAQNVRDDQQGRLEGKEADEARNKATEGLRQGREDRS
jgi:hypothetical protein